MQSQQPFGLGRVGTVSAHCLRPYTYVFVLYRSYLCGSTLRQACSHMSALQAQTYLYACLLL